MIHWTKDGKIDRKGITNLYMLNHFNSIADALDIAVAALRDIAMQLYDDEETREWDDEIAKKALRQIGVEHD